jgi:hypothetical protein
MVAFGFLMLHSILQIDVGKVPVAVATRLLRRIDELWKVSQVSCGVLNNWFANPKIGFPGGIPNFRIGRLDSEPDVGTDESPIGFGIGFSRLHNFHFSYPTVTPNLPGTSTRIRYPGY